ncbi:ABC transporter permease, partial [Lactobacillus sp. XV13L]|nr:ABC transporter permease [Lactobacillus sp. XV13L]
MRSHAMRELARKRLQDNVQQSLKYLMLVFNDFFILALIFLFGALMFWYAQSMKTMPVGLWFYRPIVGLVLCLPLLVGKLVTLFKPADLQFLLAQDEALQDYLKPLFVYSLIVPMLVLLLLAGILFPFAIIKAQISTLNYALAVFAVLLAKILQLKVEEYNLYANRKFSSMWVTLFMVIGLTTGLTAPIITYALIAVLATIAKPKNVPLVDWQYAVDQEEERKNRVYSAFSMFTDVKERQVTVKRRKYLDFLLPKSPHALIGDNPNRFLYR